MRFLKFLLFLLIIALIAGGVMYGSRMGMDWSNLLASFSSPGQNGHDQHLQHGAATTPGAPAQMASPFNTLAAQNRDKLVQAMLILTQSMDLITTDPYAQITVPHRAAGDTIRESSPGNVNVTPKDGLTINIGPGSGQNQRAADLAAVPNVVFDQTKLEQLHNGIFKFSQAMMVLNELNNDLTDQSVMQESNVDGQQLYAIRYNLTMQNRNKINQANRLLQESMVLVNVNPYAPSSGYVYNSPKMQQLHQGIYELAKSALILNRLSEEFNQQLMQIANDARYARNQPAQQHDMPSSFSNNTWIVALGIAIVVFAILLGILVVIRRIVGELRLPQ